MTESFTGYTHTDTRAIAREAAEKFAATFWERPRAIEQWRGSQFRLVDGTCWYQAVVKPGIGWEIWRVEE